MAISIELFRLFLPRVPEYQDDIKAEISTAIGLQIEFSDMDARWGISGPELAFYDTEFIYHDGKNQQSNRIIKAEEVRIGLGVLHLIFNQEFIYTWADMNKSLFSALKVERNVMFIILSLIIIVAAFNIISGLTILVKNKTRDIAILKSIGVLNKSIIKIFFLIGVLIGTSATLFGIFLGVTFSLYIENFRQFLSSTFNISLFPEEIYFLSKMPSEINPTSILLISICSILITIIVSIFPAFKAAKLDPIKALKYE